MCRPSRCSKSPHQGTGIAAAAVVTGAVAFAAARIGPVVARILHIAAEVLTIVTLTAAAALACLLVGWLTACIVRWRNRRHHAHQQTTPRPAADQHIGEPDGEPGCLACGHTGTVLRAISGSRYQARPCPACEPAQRTG